MSFQLAPTQLAVDHLHESEDNRYKVIEKLQQASAIVLKHMGYSDIPDDEFDDSTSPPTLHPAYYDTSTSPPLLLVSDDVKSAVLLKLGDLWENREGSVSQGITDAVESIIELHYDPPFA